MWFDGLFYMTVLCFVLAVGGLIADYAEKKLREKDLQRRTSKVERIKPI